jgi:hypothetical protein
LIQNNFVLKKLEVGLAKTGAEGAGPSIDVIEIDKPDDLGDIAHLGLTLAEAKVLLAGVQRQIVATQARSHGIPRLVCRCGRGVCQVKDYRDHAIAALSGQVKVRLPRFRCTACGAIEVGVDWPSHCRSTTEPNRLQARLAALMTYRTPADVLEQMFPVGVGNDKETMRRRTLRAGVALQDGAADRRETVAAAIQVTLDSTFIRSCEGAERHLKVRVGNIETESGGRQIFSAVTRSDTDIKVLIGRNLDAVGRTEGTVLTAFTDGCPGLRRILADADVTGLPMRDWFHIGMRLQHLKQIASSLSADDPARVAAKAAIVAEVERLHWRIWNGKAKNAGKASTVFALSCTISGASRVAESPSPPRKLWTAFQALDGYLTGPGDCLVNYAERHRRGLRVGTAIIEGTANFLVNRRMNKSQQMRWSRRGADLLPQARGAVCNGTFGSAHG